MPIQTAIDTAHANGGGRVTVPPGRHTVGTLHLRSNVELHLEAGAVLSASDDPTLFPIIAPTPYGNLPGQIQALIWADDCHNASITGLGTIDGNGVDPIQGDIAAAIKFRPALIFCRNCTNLRVHDVTLLNSSFWTLHLLRCRHVQIRGVIIRAVQGRINTDGIDPDGCSNVTISDCHITTGDDCIVIKSTEGDPCENIAVTNCILSSAFAAIKIGTEAIGDIRNIAVTNCIVHNSDVALALYMKDGSTYENMFFSHLIMEAASPFPLLIDNTPRYYRKPTVGRIRNITLSDIILRGPGRALIAGHQNSPIENLLLRNFSWEISGNARPFEEAVMPTGARRTDPDPAAPSVAALPYQFIFRHIRNLRVETLRAADRRAPAPADRHLLHATNIHAAHLSNIAGVDNAVTLENTSDIHRA